MRLYIVVHHQHDSSQRWSNSWIDDQLIEAIQTTKEIGDLCKAGSVWAIQCLSTVANGTIMLTLCVAP